MHLLGHPTAQEKLRQQIEQGVLALYVATQENAVRACELMRQYADAPMDFADASLVVAAEALNLTRIFMPTKSMVRHLLKCFPEDTLELNLQAVSMISTLARGTVTARPSSRL